MTARIAAQLALQNLLINPFSQTLCKTAYQMHTRTTLRRSTNLSIPLVLPCGVAPKSFERGSGGKLFLKSFPPDSFQQFLMTKPLATASKDFFLDEGQLAILDGVNEDSHVRAVIIREVGDQRRQAHGVEVTQGLKRGLDGLAEIGRASCRDRVLRLV